MKRSIRYTLLSALVLTSVSAALPVLNVKADVEEPTSQTTEVNNETVDSYISLPGLGHDDKEALSKEVGKVNAKLASQYGLKTVPALHGLFNSGLIDSYQNGVSNAIKFDIFKKSDLFKLQKAALSETASVKFLDQKNVKVQLSVRSIDKTKKVVNLDDIKNIDKAKQGFYITVNFLDSNGKSIAKSAELKYSTLPEVAATDFKEMNVSYTSPVKVGVGSSIKSVMDPKKSDLKVVLNKKGLATNAKVDMGKIYSTEAEAVKNTGRGILTSPIGKFSKFTKNNATYYQNVTVSVNDDKVKSLIKRVLLNEDGFSVTASDKIASIAENEMHFVRKISVVDATTTPDTTDPEEPETTDSAWKESSVSGIVTTGNKDYYTLVNGENKPVANRALGGNTSWITDTVRENSNGDKQYRVATNEWIDAKDITFSEGKQSTAINEITDLPRIHVVTVDTPGFVYPLFTIDGVASTRSVAGGTAWATDKVGKDSAGNTYYRVSTTEWILAGNGVHFE